MLQHWETHSNNRAISIFWICTSARDGATRYLLLWNLLYPFITDLLWMEVKVSMNDKKLRADLTLSSGLCPCQAPANCFGWWWGAGVQRKSECFSLFELLKDKQIWKERWFENVTISINPVELKKIFSPLLFSVERLRKGLLSALMGALLLPGFSSCFMVPSWSAQSYIVEARSTLPGDFSVTETSAHSLLLSTH